MDRDADRPVTQAQAVDWAEVRARFPALERHCYLNTATYGMLSEATRLAVEEHLHRRDRNACTDFLSWFDDMDRLRGRVAQLIHVIHARADDIFFIPNASSALSLQVQGMNWFGGDEILTLENEFPNQVYLPALLGVHGVKLIETAWPEFENKLSSRTRLVALSQASYSTGFVPPLAGLGKRLRANGTVLYLDATQALGALPLDVRAVEPDMVAVNAYKWMLSPNGAGFAYASPAVREWLAPNVVGWRSHLDWRNVDSLHHGAPAFAAAAEKYEGGMLNFPSLYGLAASVDEFLALGEGAIAQRLQTLMAQLHARVGHERTEEPFSPIACIRLAKDNAVDIAARLKEQYGIHCSVRRGQLRVSLHIYNNEDDIERFTAALAALGGR